VSALAVRQRLASLGGGRPQGRRQAVERRIPRGFEEVETPHGRAWRWAELEPVGRVRGTPPTVPHAYLDTETTGLAGGTGTQIFAAALCLPQPEGLEVVQLFCPEPAAEPAFLSLLQRELRRAARIGTYNGGSFDLPLLRTRWIMARLPGDFDHPEHVDLLTLTRALFRQRLESCTLRTVEDRLLGLERDDDIPGHLVPQAYFEYLRRGWSPLLEPALAHNRQDVRSLHYLHARLLERVDGGDAEMEAEDWLALGRHLLREGRRADGWRALRQAAASRDGQAAALAGLLLARGLARRRRYRAAETLLASLQDALPRHPQVTIARAKLLEWRLGDPGAAHALVAAELRQIPAESPYRFDLERRLVRLSGRRARGGRPTS
jgi:uncharacterized protein